MPELGWFDQEISLLAIGIPSHIAVKSDQQEQYQQGIQQALGSVHHIHEMLADIPVKDHQLQGFAALVQRESELLQHALVQKDKPTFKRPIKQSRLTIASKGRAPMLCVCIRVGKQNCSSNKLWLQLREDERF